MKSMKNTQQGFTLIEMIVVVSIIGVLASFLVPAFRDMETPSKAQAMVSTAEHATQTWRQIAKTCGVSSTIAGNPIPNTGKTVADVIFGGSSNVASAYTTCYAQARVKPLTESAEPSAGGYSVNAYAVSFAGGGNAPLQVIYASVADEIVLLIAQKYNRNLLTLAASDTSSAVVQYGTATAGNRNLTLFKQ